MSSGGARLGFDFYAQPTEQVARCLLGKRLVRINDAGARLSGIIVEVEAYLSAGDLASHSARGSSQKNASMFLAPGTLYVYSIHAKHCLNIVTEAADVGAAVLIRALEPLDGVRSMLAQRGLENGAANATALDLKTAIRLTAGPARLCQALGIDRRQDGLDLLTSQQVWLEDAPTEFSTSRTWLKGKRIGISQSQELPLRWFLDGHRFVSGRASEHSRGRTWQFQKHFTR